MVKEVSLLCVGVSTLLAEGLSKMLGYKDLLIVKSKLEARKVLNSEKCFSVVFIDSRMNEYLDFLDYLSDFLPNINRIVLFNKVPDRISSNSRLIKAHCLLEKDVSCDEIRTYLNQKVCFNNRLIVLKTKSEAKKNLDFTDKCLLLTKREREVLDLIVKGETSKEIANKLFLSKHTIDSHRKSILKKTFCKSPLDLIRKFDRYVVA